MNCQQVKDELALEVGQDLEEGLSSELQQHLGRCEDCCQAWIRLQESLGCLRHLQMDSLVPKGGSLWEGVEAQIQRRGLRPGARPFRGWLLGLAVGALFVALCVRVSLPPVPSPLADDMLIGPVAIPGRGPMLPQQPGSRSGEASAVPGSEGGPGTSVAVGRPWPRLSDFPDDSIRLIPDGQLVSGPRREGVWALPASNERVVPTDRGEF